MKRLSTALALALAAMVSMGLVAMPAAAGPPGPDWIFYHKETSFDKCIAVGDYESVENDWSDWACETDDHQPGFVDLWYLP